MYTADKTNESVNETSESCVWTMTLVTDDVIVCFAINTNLKKERIVSRNGVKRFPRKHAKS